MKKIIGCFMLALCASLSFAASKSLPAEKSIKKVETIAQVFGDGEKVSKVMVTYAKKIDENSVSPQSYSVECIENGKTVLRNIESLSVDGKVVTLNLSYTNKWDATGGKMSARPRPANGEKGGIQSDNGPHFDDDGIPIDVSATITQIADVKAVSGILYSASTAKIKSSKSTELILQDFKKHYFIDRETEITLPYFVYLPKDYKKNGNYPLVFFVPDASADTSIENATLTQGNGAIVWASPEEQTKHSAIVVAVQYPYSVVKEFGPLTDDSNTWTKGLTAVDNLLHNLIQNYAIDESRIYGTGQSQGCMTNIALSDKHPDLFAAQFLVAGQWNVEEMAAMKDKNLWILVCEGDEKAYPGMSAAVDLWESLGAKVARGEEMWNPNASDEETKANVETMLKKNADIRMNVFKGGSHMYTWSLAYNIEEIRDWLFSQKK